MFGDRRRVHIWIRRRRSLTVALEVIGAGFGRTGTASLKIALEMLGFGPCYHMFEVHGHPTHPHAWESAVEGGPVDWDALFASYRSAVDFPASAFWRELANYYPNARIILSDRDAESWYDSVTATILKAMLAPLPRDADPTRVAGRRMARRVVIDHVFDGRMADRDYAIDVYRSHRQSVIDAIPKERLLVHAASEGWPPLCEFLGVPVPEEPYPRSNDREEFWARVPGVGKD